MSCFSFASSARVCGAVGLGLAALAGTALSGGPSAAAGSEGPRFTVQSSFDCSGPSITFSYDDHADGHTPQAVHEDFIVGPDIVLSLDEVRQVGGHYSNQHNLPMDGFPLDITKDHGYMVSITYDDGVTDVQQAFVNLSAECTNNPYPTGSGTATTVPGSALTIPSAQNSGHTPDPEPTTPPAPSFEDLMLEEFDDVAEELSSEELEWRVEMGAALGWYNHAENSPDGELGSEDLVYLFIGLPDEPDATIRLQFHGPIVEELGRPVSNLDDMLEDPAWGFTPESDRPANQGQLEFVGELLLQYWNDHQPATDTLWVDRDA